MTAAERPFYVVDAFADRPFGGNPALIVPEAPGLEPVSEGAMRSLAAELRMEAGYILPSTTGEADFRLRFFSPTAELDFSAHVAIAAFTVLGAPARARCESRAGVHAVEIGPDGVTIDVGRPRFGPALDRKETADALRVGPGALAPLQPRMVTCGIPVAVVGMVNPPSLMAATPDMVRLAAFSRRRGVLGIAAFAQPGVHPRSALTARFFFPAVGPDEDILSGAAVAAICAYGVREQALTCVGEATFQTDSGHALGRPTRAHVTVATEAGQLASLKVRGSGVISLRGTFVA